MRLDDLRESSNLEEARGGSRGRGIGIGGLGVGGTVVVLLISMALGVDPRTLLDFGGASDPGTGPADAPSDPQAQASDPQRRFVAKILASTEDSWGTYFQSAGKPYEAPHLVLYRGTVQSGCGFAEAAVGPFYCPADARVFLDLSFFQELSQRFHAPGDFAAAYVIAHEVGHHVQNLLGITRRVEAEGRGAHQGADSPSVRLELQADCFAGVWAHDADRRSRLLEAGDLEEGIAAASAVGDDQLQRQTQGRVVPDSFTHGTSAQRVAWFRRGFESGDPNRCDTFRAERL